jgi:ligand-binding SRPBCC domain-containing protein
LGFRHVAYERHYRFAEEMIHGPFRRFSHIHEFSGNGANSSMVDVLEVQVSRVYGGSYVMKYCIAPRLRDLFTYRHESLAQLIREGSI